MSETPGSFLECLIHAGWSLRHHYLTNGGQTSSLWLSADLPASPIQLLTPTPALIRFETFCWQTVFLTSRDVYENVTGAISAWLGEAHACYLLRSIRFMKLQFCHLHAFAAAFARAHCSASKSCPYWPKTGDFLNDHRTHGRYYLLT